MSLWIWAAPMCHPHFEKNVTAIPSGYFLDVLPTQEIASITQPAVDFREIWHESRVLPRFVPSKQWVSCNGSRIKMIKSVQHHHILQAFASAQTNKLLTDIQIECRLKLAAACHRSPISQGPHARFSPQANPPQHVVIPVRIQCHDWLVGSTHSKNVQKEESVWNSLDHYPKYGWTPRCTFSILVCLGPGKSSSESHHRPRCLVQSGQCCRQFPENGWSFVLTGPRFSNGHLDQDRTKIVTNSTDSRFCRFCRCLQKVKMWCWASMIFHESHQHRKWPMAPPSQPTPCRQTFREWNPAVWHSSTNHPVSVARYESHDLYGARNWQRAHQPFAWILQSILLGQKSWTMAGFLHNEQFQLLLPFCSTIREPEDEGCG